MINDKRRQDITYKNRNPKKLQNPDYKFEVQGMNDESWYNKNPLLVQSAGQVPFNQMLGLPLELDAEITTVDADNGPWTPNGKGDRHIGSFTAPGVMSFRYALSYGWADSPASPMNIAGQRTYATMRANNSGGSNYDYTDFNVYIIGFDSILTLYSFITRAYRTCSKYMVRNRYAPTAWFNAMGIDQLELQANLANYRTQINILADKINTILVPQNCDLFKAHAYPAANIFTDAEYADMAQTYIFSPGVIYRRNDLSGVLEPVQLPNSAEPLSYYIDLLDSLVSEYLLSGDVGIMSGDVGRTWKEYVQVKYCDESTIELIIDRGLRSRIENMTVMPADCLDNNMLASWSIQEINFDNPAAGHYLEFKPKIQADSLMHVRPLMLNEHSSAPTPMDMVYHTRYTSTSTKAQWVDDARWEIDMNVIGELMIYDGRIYTSSREATYVNISTSMIKDPYSSSVPDAYAIATAFDWHPQIWMYHASLSEEDTYGDRFFNSTIVDWDVYTALPKTTLRGLHEVAIMSLFAIS